MGRRKAIFFGLAGLGLMFGLTRLTGLGLLPVFADEAIYIRWAQMINNEPQKYLFYPMFDGKTPLMMWLLIPWLALNYAEPLVMGRLVSVASGLTLMLGLMAIVRLLKGGRIAVTSAGILYILLPFTFFHDRMALTDTLYCLGLGLTFWALLKLKQRLSLTWVIMAGAAYGLTLLTKLPGLTYLLQFLLILWLMPPELDESRQRRASLMFGGAALLGLVMLYALRVSEWFPFLFQRGSDFTFSFNDIMAGQWGNWKLNLTQLVKWQGWYATAGLWLLVLAPFAYQAGRQNRQIRLAGKLILMTLALWIYFLVFGKIVYSRYYLPTIIYLIPAGALALEWLWQNQKKLLASGLTGLILIQGVWFMLPFWRDVTQIRLENRDRQQYLTEWSAGFGNREAAEYIKARAVNRPAAVATEGFFGTLPDGLSIYFDHSPLNDRVKIFGVGQPITGLYDVILQETFTRETYLLVNQNRLEFDYSECCELIAAYPRPQGGMPLWLLKVKSL